MLVEYKRTYCFIIDTATFPDDWDFDGTEENARDCLSECDIENTGVILQYSLFRRFTSKTTLAIFPKV